MANRAQTEAFIRFQLSQLSDTNQHHTFERIATWIARRRISSNIVLATGPVSAGGDQGRDAETFETLLPSELPGAAGWVGAASSEAVVVAATVQRTGLRTKISSDVAAICSAGDPVKIVAAFFTEDVPVSVQHALQEHARAEYDVRLEVFDGQAVATQLADPDLIWVAEHYLELPSHLVPDREQTLPVWYDTALRSLRTSSRPLTTPGDFATVRDGLRHATFDREARPDLPEWIGYARRFIGASDEATGRISEEISMRARYEVAVASLRGLNSLDGLGAEIREFVAYAEGSENPAILENASALIMYCGGAWGRHIGDFGGRELESLCDRLSTRIDALLAEVNRETHPMRTAQLMAAAAFHACQPKWSSASPPEAGSLPTPEETSRLVFELRERGHLPDLGESSQSHDTDNAMARFADLAAFLPNAPAFPIESICDLFELLTPLFVSDSRYDAVREAFDAAIARLAGDDAVADRCRNRALALRRAGEPLKALQQFHDAKINWWHGDTMRGSLLALRMIAEIYKELGLSYAAKQYAATAAMIANTAGDDLQDMVPDALFQVSEYCYDAGAWVDAVEVGRVALLAHNSLAEHAFDREVHPSLERVEKTFGFVLLGAELYWPELSPHLCDILATIGYEDLGRAMVDAAKPAAIWTEDEFVAMIDDQLHGRPFSDVGAARHISFAALGTRWHLTTRNDRLSVLACERFAAAAQVLLAEFASASDILLLETDLEVEVSVETPLDKNSMVRFRPSNDVTRCTVYLPAWTASSDFQEIADSVPAALFEVLLRVTVSRTEHFLQVVEEVFKRGLAHKLTFGRPYDETVDLIKDTAYSAVARFAQGPIGGVRSDAGEAIELVTPSGAGPGYNQEESLEWIKERYEWLPTLMARTLPQLVADPGVRANLLELRARGWLDWHLILAIYNTCFNYRVQALVQRTGMPLQQAMAQFAKVPEPPDAHPVPTSHFTLAVLEQALDVASLATAERFGLDVQRPDTPNFAAVQALLRRRYGYFDDDQPYDDVLGLAPD